MIMNSPLVRNVTVIKTIVSTALPGDSSSVIIRWVLTFGYADGNVPQTKILSTNIPRAVQVNGKHMFYFSC
jgi:hypothetical protein